ncbi:hypothetical protein AgCh_001263 [Apium graveolens]
MDRFGEREEVVKVRTDKLSPICLLKQEVPKIVKLVHRQLPGISVNTKVAALSVLKELAVVLPDCVADNFKILLREIQNALCDKSSTSALKLEALILTRLVLASNSPTDISRPILLAVRDSYYKVTAEALRVCDEIVRVVRPKTQGYNFDYKPCIYPIYNAIMECLVNQDQYQEVKECAISSIGLVVCTFGDNLGAELPACLTILANRMGNEITRLAAVKAFSLIAASPMHLDLSCVLEHVIADLTAFLRKQRCVRNSSNSANGPGELRRSARVRTPNPKIEKLEYVIDSPKPTQPASDAHNDEHVVYRRWIDDANVAQYIMLASMNIELQKQHEHMDAHTILMHLQELYDVAERIARYEISKELFGCRMSEGSSVNDHVLKMINLIEHLRQLGFAMDGELSQDLVLQSLPSSFSQFVVNFHMNKLDVSLPELHNMLKTAESNFPPKKSFVLLIGEGSNPKKRKRNSSKKKKVGEKMPVPPKAEDPKSKVVCFYCNKVGHWKRNCKVYLAELKKKGSETTASDSGMFMIEGPRRSRTLEEEEVILLMGNGARVAAEDVESFHLHRPTGMTIV